MQRRSGFADTRADDACADTCADDARADDEPATDACADDARADTCADDARADDEPSRLGNDPDEDDYHRHRAGLRGGWGDAQSRAP